MAPRKKSHKNKGGQGDEAQGSGEREREAGTGPEARGETEEEEEARRAARAGGLRDFMQRVQGQHHRAVEMRLVLVCGTIVTAQILFSDKLTDPVVSSITFLYMMSE